MKLISMPGRLLLPTSIIATAACTPGPMPLANLAPVPHAYVIEIDASRSTEAKVTLAFATAPSSIYPARDGDGGGVVDVRCEDGREALQKDGRWRVPTGCRRLEWTIAVDDLDATGIDADLPSAAYSRRHGFLVLPERDGLLRAGNDGGSATVRLINMDGSIVAREYAFPSINQPPFYAVVGTQPSQNYESNGFALRIFGNALPYMWMDEIHQHVLSTWSRWSRDLVSGPAPSKIDWAWVRPVEDAEPGYSASAGAEAIISQIVLRDGDPDAEAKARVVIATSAAHEGFHLITGAAGQAWPAWVNESLANHFAITAAREFLASEDHRWLNAYYVDPEVRAPLLESQALYSAGDGGQAQVFYTWGARFWREIEKVLTNQPNGSGRLAALIRETNNFADIDLNDADALADLLDQHSDDRASPIVQCFLRGLSCPTVIAE
ncbi:hypothetical protein GVM20_00320 [Porphyrobacter sp. SLTP]|uniref:hypothetical protein n=1 Tax=Porphyrobacter sp. SLTP TaxID=2683266 RepID=UPI0014127524|nr:hypothetical protein [Porphyrobacter sp. SLTP]NBB23567.1 hypothetical protein [Porphyrobacter sp. SLTP]